MKIGQAQAKSHVCGNDKLGINFVWPFMYVISLVAIWCDTVALSKIGAVFTTQGVLTIQVPKQRKQYYQIIAVQTYEHMQLHHPDTLNRNTAVVCECVTTLSLQHAYTITTACLHYHYSMPTLSLQHTYTITTAYLHHHYSIPTPSLQHTYTITTAYLHHHYSIPTPSLQHTYTITTAYLHHHYSIPTPSLQHSYSITTAYVRT
jgi:hypothetical protein